MVPVDESRIFFVAPLVGVEVETENKVGPQLGVHQPGAFPDFARSIKQDLAMPAHRFCLERIVRALKFLDWILGPARLENGASCFLEVSRTIPSHRLRF